jgi:hypothetical protein
MIKKLGAARVPEPDERQRAKLIVRVQGINRFNRTKQSIDIFLRPKCSRRNALRPLANQKLPKLVSVHL